MTRRQQLGLKNKCEEDEGEAAGPGRGRGRGKGRGRGRKSQAQAKKKAGGKGGGKETEGKDEKIEEEIENADMAVDDSKEEDAKAEEIEKPQPKKRCRGKTAPKLADASAGSKQPSKEEAADVAGENKNEENEKPEAAVKPKRARKRSEKNPEEEKEDLDTAAKATTAKEAKKRKTKKDKKDQEIEGDIEEPEVGETVKTDPKVAPKAAPKASNKRARGMAFKRPDLWVNNFEDADKIEDMSEEEEQETGKMKGSACTKAKEAKGAKDSEKKTGVEPENPPKPSPKKKQRSSSPATFARRRIPKTQVGQVKWHALKKAFKSMIKPKLSSWVSYHEDRYIQ